MDEDGDGKINYNEFAAALVHQHIDVLEEQLYHTFCAMDTDGNGVLTEDEIHAVLADDNKGLAGDKEAAVLATKTLKDMDQDGNGSINYEEFLRVMQHTLGHDPDADQGGWMKSVFGCKMDAQEFEAQGKAHTDQLEQVVSAAAGPTASDVA